MFGRNGEAPVPVVAPRSPVGLLRRRARGGADRGHLPHAGVPALGRLPGQRVRAVARPRRRHPARRSTRRSPPSRTPPGPTASRSSCPTSATPRRWRGRGRSPARPGLEHRIGGIEKADRTGEISYDPDNHDTMVRLRQAKVDAHRGVDPAARGGRPVRAGAGAGPGLGLDVRPDRRGVPPGPGAGGEVAQAHLRHLNPFPSNLGEVLRALRQGARPRDEPGLRLGASLLIRSKFLVDAIGYNRVRGLPFKAAELAASSDAIEEVLMTATAPRCRAVDR